MAELSNTFVNTELSAFCAGYTPGLYVADKLFPIIEHDKPGGTYYAKSKADIVTQYEDLAGPESEPSVISYAQTKVDFEAQARHLMGYVPYAKLDASSAVNDAMRDTTSTVLNALLLNHEIRVATIAHTTGSYASANTFAVSNVWTSPTAGTPVDDFHRAIALIAPASKETTKLVAVMALEVYQALSRHPQLLGLRAGGGTVDGVLTPDEVARKLGVDELHVSDAQYATSARGATLATSRIWTTTKCVVHRVPRKVPQIEQAQSMFGCSFRWRTTSTGGMPFEVIEWDEPKRGPGKGSRAIKVSHWTQAGAVIQNDMGVLMTSVTS